MQNKIGLIFVIVIVLACIGGFGLYAKSAIDSDPNFWAEYEAAKAESSTPEHKAEQEERDRQFMENSMPYVIGAFVLFLVFIFGGDVMRKIGKSLAVLIFFIALLAGVGYLYSFSDKNGDGRQDPQVIMAIQPNGDNVKNDAAYAKINNENAEANMTNMLTMGFLFVIISICIFILGFISMFFRSRQESDDAI